MNPNLLDMAKGRLTGEVIQKYAGYVGEDAQNTQRAFGTALPAVLAGFINHASRASSDPASSTFVRTLAEGSDEGSMLEQLSALAGGGSETDTIVHKGEGMLGSIFGNRLPAVVDHVASSSGVRRASAAKILGLAAPLMAGIVGREAKTSDLGSAGVVSMLAGQKSAVASALAGGGLTGLFGDDRGVPMGGPNEWRAQQEGRGDPKGIPLGRRLGLPLILLGAAVLAALLLMFRRTPTTPALPEHPNKMGRVEAPKSPQVFGGGPVDPADQLKRFFADPNAHAPKRVVLDGVYFAPNSAGLNATSQTSIDSVATVLKQDPTAKVRVEGFTDNTGDPANDERLSLQRAYAVRDELVRGGIDPTRIAVAGYGAERPLAPTNSPEGRAKNSRIELIVTDR